MTEKRSLTQDDPASLKTNGDHKGKKRRRILHNDMAPSPSSPSAKKQKTDSDATPTKKKRKFGGVAALKVTSAGELVPVQKKQQEEKPVVAQPSENESENRWSISRCRSGRFLNLDPVFTADGRHIILATEDELQVFPLSTSRLIRALSTHDSGSLTGYKLSKIDPNHVFASTSSGTIFQWNWETGAEIKNWKTSSTILAIDLAAVNATTEVLFTISASSKKRVISTNVLSPEGRCKSVVILTTSEQISDLRVIEGGRIVLTWARNQLIVGHSAAGKPKFWRDPAMYTWREVQLPGDATCLDVRVTPPPDGDGLDKVDVVLGESTGPIFIYNDILNRLVQCEKGDSSSSSLLSNRLHWHRKAVNAVKWSKDGNYVVSGGLETVLVLWQLDTGRKQFLPHLSAPISNIVVSPAGSAYAVKLSDNSAMVLSTSELKPIASMSGLQLPLREDILSKYVDVKKLQQQKRPGTVATEITCDRLSAILHPTQPNQLLLAVPSTQLLASKSKAPSASMLQAFDIRSGHNLSRQALTRTNVSILPTGPQGTEITGPDIKLVKISSDGDWLVTVDEWNQYLEDHAVLHPEVESNGWSMNRELYLKFWRWDKALGEWQLASRIDSPHSSPSRGASDVLDLAVNPKDSIFATIGGDAAVRIWTLDRQSDRRGRAWYCSRTVVLKKPEVNFPKMPTPYLSFSEDGSVLAACWPATSSQPEPNLVHLIDPVRGQIRSSRAGLYAGTPRGMGFLDRYLIIVSERLVVWDIVANEIKSTLFPSARPERTLLAVNPQSQTFAVSLTRRHGTPDGKDSQLLLVFETNCLEPVFQSTMRRPVRALMADLRTGGYVVVDTGAHVMRLDTGDKLSPSTSTYDDQSSAVAQSGLENLFGGFTDGSRQLAADNELIEGGAATKDWSGSSKTLADIFDVAPPFALPSVDDLFKNVVDLLGAGAVKS